MQKRKRKEGKDMLWGIVGGFLDQNYGNITHPTLSPHAPQTPDIASLSFHYYKNLLNYYYQPAALIGVAFPTPKGRSNSLNGGNELFRVFQRDMHLKLPFYSKQKLVNTRPLGFGLGLGPCLVPDAVTGCCCC